MQTTIRVFGGDIELRKIAVGAPGPQGPQGPAGPSGGASFQLIASGAIGGHRVVISDGAGNASYADSSNVSHAGKVAGISLGAVSSGASVNVASSGEIVEPTWGWGAGLVYLGVNGVLTQTAPTSGFLQVIGVALSATRIVVSLQIPVILI